MVKGFMDMIGGAINDLKNQYPTFTADNREEILKIVLNAMQTLANMEGSPEGMMEKVNEMLVSSTNPIESYEMLEKRVSDALTAVVKSKMSVTMGGDGHEMGGDNEETRGRPLPDVEFWWT